MTLANFTCILLIFVGFYILFDARNEFFSPMNSYDVENNTPAVQTAVTELPSTKSVTNPSLDTVNTLSFSLFVGNFPLAPLFTKILSKEFPDYSFNPELNQLKISPDNNQFVFKISGLTKSDAKFLRLLVNIQLQNPDKYINPDGNFFIPSHADPNDFIIQGVSIDPIISSTSSVQPNSPFLSNDYRIINNMYLMGPFLTNSPKL